MGGYICSLAQIHFSYNMVDFTYKGLLPSDQAFIRSHTDIQQFITLWRVVNHLMDNSKNTFLLAGQGHLYDTGLGTG